jgi:hypothetical protein
MSKQTINALLASNCLTQALTAAVLDASKEGLSRDQILAVLARITEVIEADDEE